MARGFRWNGRAVAQRTKLAARTAVDQTTARAVVHAKTHHPWKNVTGTLEGSLQMRPAVFRGNRIEGEWGSFDVEYAIFLELGTRNMRPYPYLRPAADAEYPALAKRIRGMLA